MGKVVSVNAIRGVFCVRCENGTFAYFRVPPRDLPALDAEVTCPSCPCEIGASPKSVFVRDGGREIRALNSVVGLPKDIADILVG